MKLLLLATALLSTFRPVDTAYNVGHFMLKERGSRGGRYCIGARDGEIVVDNRLIIEPCNELKTAQVWIIHDDDRCLLYTSPSPRDAHESRMPSSA